MQEKLAAGAEISPRGSRKHKNVGQNMEVEVGDGTGNQAVNEKAVEEPATDLETDGEPAAHADAATPELAAASAAQDAGQATDAKVPVQAPPPFRTEAREKSMAERLRFKRRIRRQIR